MASPLNTNVTWPLLAPTELVELVELVLLPESECLKSIQGTATSLPPAALELLELPRVLPLAPPTPLLELLEPGLVELGLVELEVSELPVAVPEGLVEAPVLLEPLNERIAKSIRPEVGLMMQSLIVPNWVPDELLT